MVYLAIMYGLLSGYVQDPLFWLLLAIPCVLGLLRKSVKIGAGVSVVLAMLWVVMVYKMRAAKGLELPEIYASLSFLSVLLAACLVFVLGRMIASFRR